MAKRTFDKKGGGRDREPKEFEEEVLQIDRVTRVVKGGRRMRFRILVAIGDKKGRVAIGIGKAAEVVNGIKKAITQAKKDLIRVPINDNGSIPHDVRVKYKASKIMIMPAMAGTGIIAGGSLRKILMLAGVKNVFGKRFGTNNRMVTAQAAMLALKQLRPVKQSKKTVAVEAKPAEGKAPVAKVEPTSAKASVAPAKQEKAVKPAITK